MNTLTLELLSSILSNIGDDAIGQLSITSNYMRNITNELTDDAIFYKTRVENLLDYPIDSYTGDWKGFYYILIELAKEHHIKLILNDALVSAASDGNNLAIKVLLSDQRVDPSTRNKEAIQVASLKGHIEIVKLLLADKRVDPSDNNNKAIRWASVSSQKEIVMLLLANQLVDPSANNNEAIRWASRDGNIEVVKASSCR